MITRQLIDEINELKHELILLQSLSQLVSTALEHGDDLDVVHCVSVARNMTVRLGQVLEQLEIMENSLDCDVESVGAQWEITV